MLPLSGERIDAKGIISEKLDSEEANYQREEELFEVFSNKASLIRPP